jgi:hypothetical protein
MVYINDIKVIQQTTLPLVLVHECRSQKESALGRLNAGVEA